MTAIDRLAPTVRPPGRAAGWQSWRQLGFLHWPVPVAALRARVPARMELDLFDGVAYVGVVPFAMQDVQPRWAPFAVDFLETNVRTYVVVDGEPGVYFFSLEAASWPAVLAARATFGLPYFHAAMTLDEPARGELAYRSRRTRGGVRHASHVRVGEALGPSQPGTLEHFLLERYLLFVETRGQLRRAQVHHTPYPVHRAEVLACDDELVAAAGLPPARGLPPLVHWSPGVDVEVFAPADIGARLG